MIQQMLAIWSLVPLPFLKPACTSGSSQFTYCWSLAWRILSITFNMWDVCNCVVVWVFFGLAFLWGWNANWPFPVLWPLLRVNSLISDYYIKWIHQCHNISSILFTYFCFRASLGAQMVKNPPAIEDLQFGPWVRKRPCRREWLTTPVFLPGEFHGQRSLVGYSPWSCKESDITEQLTF